MGRKTTQSGTNIDIGIRSKHRREWDLDDVRKGQEENSL